MNDEQPIDVPEFLPADTEILPPEDDDLVTIQEVALPPEDEDPTVQTSAVRYR